MSSSIPHIVYTPQFVPASQAAAVIEQPHGFPLHGSRVRFDVVCGAVAGTPAFKLQHSTLPFIWQDTKNQVAVAAAGTTCTFSAGSQTITATAHGLSVGQLVMFSSSDVLPGAFTPHAIYQVVEAPTANTFTVKPRESLTLGVFAIADAGSGTHKVVACQTVSITFNPEVAGDQAHLPLRPRLRFVCATGGAESAQIGAIYVSYAP